MTEPIRILQVVGSLGSGGIQSYLMELYRHIDRSRVQFDFVVHIRTEQSYASEVESLGGRVFYIDGDAFEKKAWARYIGFWKRFFREHPEYQIVHGHLRSTSAVYLSEAKRAGRYTIAHSHATNNGYGLSAKAKDVLQFPTRYIADSLMGCSRQANEWMYGKRMADRGACSVLRNGIDAGKYVFSPEIRNAVRRKLGISDDTFVIGTVGRLVEQKNQRLLIDAFAQTAQMRDDCLLLIVGDGPLRPDLEKRMVELGLRDKAMMLGNRTDVNELLQAFDCFVMTSRNEGFSIAAVEAQAADLPLLVSPAIPEEACLTDSVYRIGSFEAEEWAEWLFKLERKARADNSGLIAEAGYDISTIAAQLTDFYLSRTEKRSK